jgi:hypothetical protein
MHSTVGKTGHGPNNQNGGPKIKPAGLTPRRELNRIKPELNQIKPFSPEISKTIMTSNHGQG